MAKTTDKPRADDVAAGGDTNGNGATTSRRALLAMAAGTAVAAHGLARGAKAQTAAPAIRRGGGLNIVFVFTDQERYRSKWPTGVSLPAHERLQRSGVTFHNHYCPATMCTSSRSVLLTGLTTPNNRMFENADVPWVKSMSTEIPTIGHMLRKAGYYTAYKGKWHLTKEFDSHDPNRLFTSEMEKYGFSDFYGPGDIIGHTLGGYQFDHLISGSAVTWLRRNGKPMSEQGKPWCMFVSLVNPHDVMYFNTDEPGQKVQDTGHLMNHAARAPSHPMYAATWDQPLPDTLKESLDAPGRPRAHREFLGVWDHVLGHVPLEEARWRRFNDYYINCTRNVDAQVNTILRELDDLGLADRTIFVFTSDHGEMAGAHGGLRGKGPFAYEETIHLPFHMVHPDVRGGQDCKALTAHMDVVPTLLSMAGVQPGRAAELAGQPLAGKDISTVLGNPGAAATHAVRDSILFTYSGIALNDAETIRRSAAAVAAGKNPKIELLRQRYLPDLKKRGSLRTVFDGRYKLTRYFSPVEHNTPTTIEDLYKYNDVELFDLQNDPSETKNLGIDRAANRDLIASMNGKLNAIIKTEIGADDGRELPNIPTIDWAIDKIDM